MPSEGRRLHGFTVVSRGLGLARQLLFPAIIAGASAGGGLGGSSIGLVGSPILWITLFGGVPSLVLAVAHWWAFRFHVAGDDLIINSGVLRRRRRVIPLARLQNVDLEQSFLERLVGVAELRMETASGGQDTEASIQVLALQEATELQAHLLQRRAAVLSRQAGRMPPSAGAAGAARRPDAAFQPEDSGSGAAGPAAPGHLPSAGPYQPARPPRQLLKLGVTDLAIAGATSNESGLIAAGLATVLEVAPDIVGVDTMLESIDTPDLGIPGAILFSAIAAVTFIVAGWLVSIVATMVRFHGFTLTRSGDDLHKEYGLFSRHRSTVPLARVQAVRIEETLLRRPLGLTALKIETAGAGPQRQQQNGPRAEAFVPLARRRDVGRLLREVFEDAEFQGMTFHPVAPVSRSRSFRRLAIPIVLATALGLALLDARAGFLLLLLPPAWLLARAQYRARAWARSGEYALARGGVLTRVTWVIPRHKVQTLHLRETPFQRRHDIGTVLIDTAAGGRAARIVDVPRDTGTALLQSLHYLASGRDAAPAGSGTPRGAGPDTSPKTGYPPLLDH